MCIYVSICVYMYIYLSGYICVGIYISICVCIYAACIYNRSNPDESWAANQPPATLKERGRKNSLLPVWTGLNAPSTPQVRVVSKELQCCCSVFSIVLQCTSVYCSVLQCGLASMRPLPHRDVWYQKSCSVLQCVAVCCGVLQCEVVCCSVMQCVAV